VLIPWRGRGFSVSKATKSILFSSRFDEFIGLTTVVLSPYMHHVSAAVVGNSRFKFEIARNFTSEI
jgi:hypothetical protein